MFEFAVLGAGRWGSLISWYINKLGYDLVLWGRKNSENFQKVMQTRNNSKIYFDFKIKITYDLNLAFSQEYIIISINAQNFRDFLFYLYKNNFDLNNKKIILCMKGIEESTGKRLSEIFKEFFPENKNLAIWVGPGHVQSLISGIPTCMIIDSENNNFKLELCKILSSNLIKCFAGNDLIGSEIGAASKNIFGIAAGILDAMHMESLKGPLMSLGSLEISKLIDIMGGKKESAFGLCHLGDFQATLFSKESNNRKFGESLITGEKINFIAEGVGTANAIHKICKDKNLNLPICNEIYKIINYKVSAKNSINYLLSLN